MGLVSTALAAAESSDCKQPCSVHNRKEEIDILQLQHVLGGAFLVHGTVLFGLSATRSLHGFCLYALRAAMVEFGAANYCKSAAPGDLAMQLLGPIP